MLSSLLFLHHNWLYLFQLRVYPLTQLHKNPVRIGLIGFANVAQTKLLPWESIGDSPGKIIQILNRELQYKKDSELQILHS